MAERFGKSSTQILKEAVAVLSNPREGGRQARLPETLETFTIGDMQPDDVRFAQSYAMRVSHDRRVWLDSKYPTSPVPVEDALMVITRTLEGFSVEVSDLVQASWDLEGPEFFDDYFEEEVEWIPVVHLFDRADRLNS